jgi:hypothetical protein
MQPLKTLRLRAPKDFWSSINASDGFSEGNGDYDEIIKEAKAAASAASDTVKLTIAATAGAVNIAGAATVGLLVPTSQAELDAANATIAAYEAPAKPPSQNKSAP